jgi:hypothetical protein
MVGGFNGWHYSAEVGGHVSMTSTWSSDKSPFVAVADVTVDSPTTLTVQAGTTVKFGDSLAFRVLGALAVPGTADDPATITRVGPAGHFSMVIEGTIDARHVNFEYFDSSGVSIHPAATIEELNYVGFLNDDIPGSNGFLQLTLGDDTLRSLTFNGGTPSEDCNVTLHGDGTLTVYGYGGDFGGPDYDCPGDGAIVWLDVIRGDANGDWVINVGDVVYLVSYLYKGGAAPNSPEAGDCNCDGETNVGDVVYLVSYLYKGGPPPGCP